MTTLLYLLVYAIGAVMAVSGLLRFGKFRLRKRRCTAVTTGVVADVAEKHSLLAWPASVRYYPIFEYTPEGGQTRIAASDYYSQTKDSPARGAAYPIRYDPDRPARFYAQGWDEPGGTMGLVQLVFGAGILAVTLISSLIR